jgi:hypothetical protein
MKLMKNLDHIHLFWPSLFGRLSRSRTCEVGSPIVVKLVELLVRTKRARYINPQVGFVASSESNRVYHVVINMNVDCSLNFSKLFAMPGHIVALGTGERFTNLSVVYPVA